MGLQKKGGAHAIKLQSYKAENLASKYAKAYWDTKKKNQKINLNCSRNMTILATKSITKFSKDVKKFGINFLSTPFDNFAVDYLDKYVNFFKIASADITNLPLISHVASKKKPIIISTGASDISEIHKAIKTIKKKSNAEICIMHCILNYPTRKS